MVFERGFSESHPLTYLPPPGAKKGGEKGGEEKGVGKVFGCVVVHFLDGEREPLRKGGEKKKKKGFFLRWLLQKVFSHPQGVI